ncbi:MAG: cryptochrome/photolyase family protein [Proteobacteria bacterium]|nr:MAG: cryptochrome/photolyase family protein [Pseudomonadota bacterium]
MRIVLGDQLANSVSALRDVDLERDVILMAEVAEEATCVKHHRKKLAFVFSAMRHFSAALADDGATVRYIRLDDSGNTGSLGGEVRRAVVDLNPVRVVATHPGEYRLLGEMKNWRRDLGIPMEIRADDRFLVSLDDFRTWADGRRTLRMENFYRETRKQLDVLMDGSEPAGGRWNFDAENRKRLPDDEHSPPPRRFCPDDISREVIDLVARNFKDHFGDLEPFDLGVTRAQALLALDDFICNRLTGFGDYQDAMRQKEPVLFHSVLSCYLNVGLLNPMEVVEAAEASWRTGRAPLNAVEGFVRQVVGWREYVRGVYWLRMPAYADRNYLDAGRALPEFYWNGETRMNCLRQCIGETKRNAYAHHIQRLMVLGNFALLVGADPTEVNEWYLVVYADAYEWVELPNVTGMILLADGGYLASKPYAAGGAYINRMSDYCRHCEYEVSRKSGESACPFNYLYWDFLDRNRDKLAANPRLAMPYRTLDRMDRAKIGSVRADTRRFLERLDAGLPT